jgi:hypothetical protein
VAALELVRLREGIGRLAEETSEGHCSAESLYGEVCVKCSGGRAWVHWPCGFAARADELRALLDDNEGER